MRVQSEFAGASAGRDGQNGAGKPRCFKMIAARLNPTPEAAPGPSLTMGYFAQQSLDVLNADLTIIDQLQNDFPATDWARYAAGRGLPVLRATTSIKKSARFPWQKSRLAMAACSQPAQLSGARRTDQPSSIATKEMLAKLQGIRRHMIFVSHDRMFSKDSASGPGTGRRKVDEREPLVYPGRITSTFRTGHEAGDLPYGRQDRSNLETQSSRGNGVFWWL